MTEQDNIKELFSRSLENHSMPVRPEVWNGLQAKMAAAGLASTATAATAKGMSVLSKWIIGGTAAAVVGVTTTVLLLQPAAETPPKSTPETEQTTASAQPDVETTTAATPETHTQQPVQPQPGLKQEEPQQWIIEPVRNPAPDERSFLVPAPTETPHKVLPHVSPTVVPRGGESPKVEVQGLTENKEITPEETITEFRDEKIEFREAVLKMPNVFNPNGDGINDEYFVTSANISEAQVFIHNAKNDVVFKSDDIHFRWNGRINNSEDLAEKGMYACVIFYKDAAGKTHKKIQLLELR